MPIQSIERVYNVLDPDTEVGIRLNGVGKNGFIQILYADIPGNSWNANRLKKLTERAQELIDVRIPLNDPSLVDDPDALVDPGRPDFFHDGGDLVSRSIIISNVSFTDRLIFTLTRAR